MPKRHNGNGNGGNGNGHGDAPNGDAQVAAIRELQRAMTSGFEKLTSRIDYLTSRVDNLENVTVEGFGRLNARVDHLSSQIQKTNVRLDQVVLNTGAHYRGLSKRVEVIEQKLKVVRR